MPDNALSASQDDAQSFPEKFCPDCGVRVFGRTLHKQYCEPCGVARRKARDVRSAEKQRRKRGIPKVKGEEFPCQECGDTFVATSKSRAMYCHDCRPIVALRHSNASSKRRSSDPERRERFNEWWRNRGKEDPCVALSRMMRSLMYREIGRKSAKRGSWFELVGYTAEELRCHLEKQFVPGMTWENRGHGWHVDHIRPIASFNYDGPDHPDFKACWALTNLQPLWAADNIRKRDKLEYLI